jgi:general secretion pathway protein G
MRLLFRTFLEAFVSENPIVSRRRSERGITLIELLVVMVIIALFATLVGGRLFSNVDRARQTHAKSQIAEFSTVLDLYRLDVGRYPTAQQGLQALRVQPEGVNNWDGPYLRGEVPMDPWGYPYVYRNPGEHDDFDLISLGSDGEEGGEEIDADIVSWE